ncbi:hypothetical protein BJ878DRAFT_519421 [Calycina marina]|uniref:Thioredoxin domain-containing protein n=1 Tax=Calycina marina TaxID=1763456 RepID=A0A9P8CDV5_9HELO|nr:hypothetical protein BJ878DRAFT_519421 [Calycina marina]
MIPKPITKLARASIVSKTPATTPVPSTVRRFSSTKDNKANNRMYTPVRCPDDFQSYLLLSTASQTPLLTLWTTSYCRSCATVLPLITSLIQSGVGEAEGGVSFCEIEYDSQDIMDSGLAMTYMITSMPTLLAFDRGEAQLETREGGVKRMAQSEWLEAWIRREASRRGEGGGGGWFGEGKSVFGGLFGGLKK